MNLNVPIYRGPFISGCFREGKVRERVRIVRRDKGAGGSAGRKR